MVDTLTSRVGIVDEVRGREVRLRALGGVGAAWTTLRCAVRDAGEQEVRSGRVDLLHGRREAASKGGGGWCVVCAQFDADAVVVGWVESASAAPRGLYACPAHREQATLPAELESRATRETEPADEEVCDDEAAGMAASHTKVADTATAAGETISAEPPEDEASRT